MASAETGTEVPAEGREGSFSYTDDGDGRLSSLANPFSQTSGWTYLDNGWLSTQTLGNGAVTTDSYNGLGELTELLNQDNASNTLSEFSSLVYNASGSRTSATATLTGVSSLSGSLSYGYDSKDELTSDGSTRSAGSYTHSFSYDSAGNPTTWMGGSKSFNSDNQNTANTFDGNGNPTTYDSTTLTFDPENRMTAFGSALTAGYRADGLRAWKDGSSETYFLYDGTLPVVELNSSGTVIAANTFGDNGLLSRRVSSTSTFYQFDPQGGTAQRLNSSCSVTSSTRFDAWGNVVGTAGSDPFQYGAQAGYYTDTETGLGLLTLRYYDSAAGRFLTRDPLGAAGGINVYSYTGNDPSTALDPGGECPWCAPAVLGGVAGGVIGGVAGWWGAGGWSGVGKGIVLGAIGGAVSGATLGLGGPGIAGALGGGWLGGAAAGGLSGAAGSAASQGTAMWLGWQNGWDPYSVGASCTLGAVGGGLMFRPVNPTTTTITRWGGPVSPGGWVQVGAPNPLNWSTATAGKYPYLPSTTIQVPGGDLQYPPGFWGGGKGLVGQRIYMPQAPGPGGP